MRNQPIRLIGQLLLVAGLTGCAAISSIDSASQSVATYELTPVAAPAASPGRSGLALFVQEPVAGASLATDRILIKPGALQVAYLPDGRWVDAAPVHIQTLLTRSLANSGRLGFVSSRSQGPLAEYVLLTDLDAFQAETGSAAAPEARVVVRMTLTLVREPEGRVVASRRFERIAVAADTSAAAIVPAFEAAMTPLLTDATGWTAAVLTGVPGA